MSEYRYRRPGRELSRELGPNAKRAVMIPVPYHAALTEIADRDRRGMSSVATIAIEEYLARENMLPDATV